MYDSYDQLIGGGTLRRVFKFILVAIVGWFIWDLQGQEAGEMNIAIVSLFVWFVCMFHLIPIYWVSKRTAAILLVMPFILVVAQVSLYAFILPLWPDGGSGFVLLDLLWIAAAFLGVFLPLVWACGGSKALPDAEVQEYRPVMRPVRPKLAKPATVMLIEARYTRTKILPAQPRQLTKARKK